MNKMITNLPHRTLLVYFYALSVATVCGQPVFQQVGNLLIMSNADVTLQYNLGAGTTDFYWQNSKKISAFYAGVGLSTGYITGNNAGYSNRTYTVVSSNQVVVTSQGGGLPMMKQYFTLDQNDSFLTSVAMVGSGLSANWMGPVVVSTTGGVDIGITNDNRALFVPFDNDDFVTYNAMSINSSSTSYEVSAFYDNTTRNGLVVGSVTHDTWKTGVYFNGANNKLNQMNVYGGAISPWDVAPHGYVSGTTISSPTVFVGFGADWRTTMESYAVENTKYAPKLPWTNAVPFGWNSWGVTNYQNNISYAAAIAVSDFFHTNLEVGGFTNQGTVYINLDSYWSNLSNTQLQQFANHCHANGQKAGIYWTPFVYWGTASQGSNSLMTGSTTYYWSNAYLRTTNGNVQTIDGAIALDPTHPGVKQLIQYYVNLFTYFGFDYLKSDFMSHGALEGVHYDPNATTGIQAYNEGMSYIISQINGRMFMSESIAPLFPYQYGHARRIACDSYTSLISNTAYTMNSVSYGWWLDGLYQFNDPDIMVFNGYGATTNENQSRLICGAVTGIFLDGDVLTNSASQAAAQMCLTNAAINSVARVGQTFTPVEGNTGTSAANIFIRQENASTWSIAVFNYTSKGTNETVSLSRAGLPTGNYIETNLWDGTTTVVSGSFNVSLNAKQAKLFRLTFDSPANLQWSANGNSGIWDTANSANWINMGNSQQVVFNANDQVLFDDTAGVPTTVTVNGTVSPGGITVNSSTNNFVFSGPGTISGSGSLLKEGGSTLTLGVAGGLTGPVIIGGGVVATASNTLTSVSSITITNGGTLDFDGTAMVGNKPITIFGVGVNGEGALFNSSGVQYDQVLDITLVGDTTFGSASGGNSRWDLGDGSTLAGPYKVTISNPNGGYGEWDTVTIATNVGDMELAQGSWGLKGLGAGLGDPTKTITVDAGTALTVWNSSYGPNSGFYKNIHMLTNSSIAIRTSPSTFFNANMNLEGGALLSFYNGSGSGQTMNGTYSLNGVIAMQVSDSTITFANVINGPGGFVWNIYNNEVVFTASNTYSGPTVIGGGLTLGLSGNGSISQSSLIFFGGNNPANDSLDVSGRPDQTLTLASGQTLGGIGNVNGSLAISAGATLSPAGTNTLLGINSGASSTGVIAASGAIALNGTTIIKLNGSGTNDEVQAGAGITYGGTLNLANISGSPLVAGNSFQIFYGASYSGSFASITPATPGTGLAWDLTQLNTGILNVVAATTQPVIGSIAVSGGNLIFSGTGGTTNGSYFVLTSTNLAAPLANWIPVATNTFDASGNFSATNAVNSNSTQQYYLLKLP
jgi:hypothetical protein